MTSMMRIGFGLKGSSENSFPCRISPGPLIQRRLKAKKPNGFLTRGQCPSLSPYAELAKQDPATGETTSWETE